jgi:hypothetical protein
MASPSPSHEFTVSVSGTFTYTDSSGGNETITVSSGDITKISPHNFQFELAAPVELGSIDDFLTWLESALGIGTKGFDLSTYKNDVPSVLYNAFEDLLNEKITITSLVINVPKSEYAFGVSLPMDISIFPSLTSFKLTGIGILVSSGAGGSPS